MGRFSKSGCRCGGHRRWYGYRWRRRGVGVRARYRVPVEILLHRDCPDPGHVLRDDIVHCLCDPPAIVELLSRGGRLGHILCNGSRSVECISSQGNASLARRGDRAGSTPKGSTSDEHCNSLPPFLVAVRCIVFALAKEPQSGLVDGDRFPVTACPSIVPTIS